MFKTAKEKLIPAICGSAPLVLMGTTAFASGSSGGSGDGLTVTSDMLMPIVDAIKANLQVILPVGVTIFGILIAIALIPKAISKFTNR